MTDQARTATVYLCALCDGQGTLHKLRPTVFYACRDCVRKHDNDPTMVLFSIVHRLRRMAIDHDPRVTHPRVIDAVRSLKAHPALAHLTRELSIIGSSPQEGGTP